MQIKRNEAKCLNNNVFRINIFVVKIKNEDNTLLKYDIFFLFSLLFLKKSYIILFL